MLRFFFFLLSLHTADFRLHADASKPGPLASVTLDFRDIKDGARPAKNEDASFLGRLFKARHDEESKTAGRAVPIKVHLPEGEGHFPVIVISHGAGGGVDTHAGQARHLASHGYAVLCVEHIGSNLARLTKGFQFRKNLAEMTHDSEEVLARPKDISFALDMAVRWNQAHPKLRGRLDLSRVGILGHSFGAYTAMMTCGMRPALDKLTPRIEPGKGLGPDLSDARIKCGVALSPQGDHDGRFIRDSFRSLKVPLMGVSGTLDDQQDGSPAQNRRDSFALWPKGDHAFVWISDARHVDFTDSSGTDAKELPSPSRNAVQPVTKAATLLFLDQHLKPDNQAKLTSEVLKTNRNGEVTNIEVLLK